MSVVVAYQETDVGNLALREAAREADRRQAVMIVANVPESVDIDILEATEVRLNSEIAEVLSEDNLPTIKWNLHVITGEDAAEAVLDLVGKSDAELIVVGARRRSRVGKLIMGSVTQSIVLDANVPVLVVKTPTNKH